MAASSIEAVVGGVFRWLDIEPFHPVAFAVLPVLLFLLRRRGKSAGYLVCFSLFFFYVWTVLTYTIFKFAPQSANEFSDQVNWFECIHLVPKLLTGKFDPRSYQVYGNFLLGIPFGFGLPFVVASRNSTPKRVVLLGLGFAMGIEVAQLLIGLFVFRSPYRIVDIDDVLLVFAGTLLGYGVLWGAARVYRRIAWARGAELPVWDHAHTVLLNMAKDRVARIDPTPHENHESPQNGERARG